MYTLVPPQQSARAKAYEMWIHAPMPMVTILKTLDVSRLARLARRHGMRFNMLMCFCIGRATQQLENIWDLPTADGFRHYDSLCVNVIVACDDGSINFCDIPFDDNLRHFAADYERLTRQVKTSGQMYDLSESTLSIGTSALVDSQLDAVINGHSGHWTNPFFAWGRYRHHWWQRRAALPVSLQFHHAQMDGRHAATILGNLQHTIDTLRIDK